MLTFLPRIIELTNNMNVTLYRTLTNRLYTQGEIYINGKLQTCTVEATEDLLPAGTYSLSIVKKSARRQSLVVFRQKSPQAKPVSTGHSIAIGHSWICSLKEHIIVIGTELIPGSMFKSKMDYERIIDRISKCMARGESIELTISEERCEANQPIRHWLIPLN